MARTNSTKILTYTELIQLSTFEDRFKYLQLGGFVGKETFGFDRYLNQRMYRSSEWRNLRNYIIDRDNCCDLGIKDRPIFERPIIHHLNPITVKDIEDASEYLFDPNYLITTTHITHNAIHYGDESFIALNTLVERKPNDTCPWRNNHG